MNIFYSKSEGRANVPCDHPVSVPVDTALAVFRGLDSRGGFMGIELDERFCLQLAHTKHDKVRVELLDASIPAYDACDMEFEFVERLIKLAADGQDVFQIARATNDNWEHWDLARKTVSNSSHSLPPGSSAPSNLSENTKADRTVSPIEFTATEMGFTDGLGGASNSKSAAPYHYILFGKQVDPQHSWNSGIYFEFDSQRNGGVNHVVKVVLAKGEAHFSLRDGQTILVCRSEDDDSWQKFVKCVHEVFEELVEQKA